MAGSSGQPTFGFLPWQANYSAVNAIVRENNNGMLGMGRLYTADVLNSEIAWQVWMDVGTWKIAYVYQTSAGYGIATFLIDGVSVGTIDQYAAAGTTNNYGEVASISVTTAGLKTFTIRAASKHASSTGYFLPMNSVALIKTAGAHSTPAGTDTPGYTWQFLPWMGEKAKGGVWARSQDSAKFGGGSYVSDVASGNYLEWDIWLDAGTYKFAGFGSQTTDAGIWSLLLNGVSKATIDMYAAAATANVYVEATAIAIAAAGVYTFRLTSTTKNASSTAFTMYPYSLAWIRTGA